MTWSTKSVTGAGILPVSHYRGVPEQDLATPVWAQSTPSGPFATAVCILALFSVGCVL
jgi:hypothetical protein